MKLNKITAALLTLGLASPAWADFTIGELRIEGEQHTSEATVRSLLPVKAGDVFNEEVGENIIRRLHASGFYENVLLEQNGNMLIVTVTERPIISDLTVTGGKILKSDNIQKQISTIRGTQAASDTDLIAGEEKTQEEVLRDFETRAAYNAANALASAGLGKGDFFSQEALSHALGALYSEYLEQGKHNVKITPNVQRLDRNRVAITIDIDEGKTTRVNELNFEGNEKFSDYRLSRVVRLTDGTLMSWATKSNVFGWQKFNQDQVRLENFYRDKGYFYFKVNPEDVTRRFSDDKEHESVTITVHEGERYYWGDVSIAGDSKEVAQDKLQKRLRRIKPGKLSNYNVLQDAMAAIRYDLQSAGYANAQVTAAHTPREENGKHFVDIVVQINPGNRVAVRNITISGNKQTRDEVIRRELRQMESATYNQEHIERSKQRLDQLGYFERTEIVRTTVPEDEQQVDLAVKVAERRTGSVNASVGWSQDDGLVLAGGIAQDNLFGTGKSVSFSASRSKVRQGASLSFTDPYFTADGVSMSYSLFGSIYDPSKLSSNSRNYRTTRYGVSAVMGIPITEYDRVNVGLGVERMSVKLFDVPPYRYQRFVDENGEKNWIYKGILSWYRNTTDDSFWPTRGYQTNVTGEIGLPGSGLQYYQFGHQQTWYFPLNKTFTLMLNGQMGYSGNYGKTREVPFMYNQSGGGLGSVRGYESGSLGPKVYDANYKSSESYGGKYAVNANAELLFPFPGMKDSRNVRLSIFADAGSVWDGKTYNSAPYSDNNPYGSNGLYKNNHKSDFHNELRYSSGAALTWLSPMGPIKLSYAVPLKKKERDQIQRFQFQLGTVF